MIEVTSLLLLLLAHWVGDFVLQPRWIGENKSKGILILLLHGLIYSMPVAIVSYFVFEEWLVPWLLIVDSHIFIDYFSSKVTKYFYKKNKIYLFFTTIGFDQLLHTGTIIFALYAS